MALGQEPHITLCFVVRDINNPSISGLLNIEIVCREITETTPFHVLRVILVEFTSKVEYNMLS